MPDWFIIGCAILICLILGYDILYMLMEQDRRKKKREKEKNSRHNLD